jgi:hypothetical protein
MARGSPFETLNAFLKRFENRRGGGGHKLFAQRIENLSVPFLFLFGYRVN